MYYLTASKPILEPAPTPAAMAPPIIGAATKPAGMAASGNPNKTAIREYFKIFFSFQLATHFHIDIIYVEG